MGGPNAQDVRKLMLGEPRKSWIYVSVLLHYEDRRFGGAESPAYNLIIESIH